MAQLYTIGTLWLSLGLHTITSVLLLIALGFMIHASVEFSDKEDVAYAGDGVALAYNLFILGWAYYIHKKRTPTSPQRIDLTWTTYFEFAMCVLLACCSIIPWLNLVRTRECGMDRATCEALWFRPAKPYLRNAFLLMLGAAGAEFLLWVHTCVWSRQSKE
ncbi:hypothetical protein VTJ04DRAFT_1514 [Mycothermus thermophilus]|uniref:uncharacterized protein n=1 Tax=Humicola insolens TaxID=85995 RepID=UPI003742A55F